MIYLEQIKSDLIKLFETLTKKTFQDMNIANIPAAIDQAITQIKDHNQQAAMQKKWNDLKKQNQKTFEELAQKDAVIKAAQETFDNDPQYKNATIEYSTGKEAIAAMKLAFSKWLETRFHVSLEKEKKEEVAKMEAKTAKLEQQKESYLEVHDENGKLLMSCYQNKKGYASIMVPSSDLKVLEKVFEFAGNLSGGGKCNLMYNRVASQNPPKVLEDFGNFYKAIKEHNEKYPNKKITIGKETIEEINNIKKNPSFNKDQHQTMLEQLVQNFTSLLTKPPIEEKKTEQKAAPHLIKQKA